MIGEDQITLDISSQLHIHAEVSGQLKAQATRAESRYAFTFREFESGNFAPEDGAMVFKKDAEWNFPQKSWELLPALAPA